MSRLYPTPNRRALLAKVDTGGIVITADGASHNTSGDVTTDLERLAEAGWIIPVDPAGWQLTALGKAILRIRILDVFQTARFHAVTGQGTELVVLGYTERIGPAGWLVQVRSTVLHTTRSQAAAELFHHAALALVEQAEANTAAARLAQVRKLLDDYLPEVPPIFQGTGRYAEGMQAIARAVRDILDGAEA